LEYIDCTRVHLSADQFDFERFTVYNIIAYVSDTYNIVTAYLAALQLQQYTLT